MFVRFQISKAVPAAASLWRDSSPLCLPLAIPGFGLKIHVPASSFQLLGQFISKRGGMDNHKKEKVKKFEEFVDQRLKPDLVRAIAERDKIFEQQKIFSDLKKNIETLQKNGVTSLRSMVNLGSEVYMQADVPDTRHIFVDVGMGFHVEFTWTEAQEFIEVKLARLDKQLEEYTHLIASIKAQIKMVCEGIRELLQIPA
ncbi:hypothetical protein H6P81_004729 [Aristolochia fimbriata]|uniref:Uncharacterized protein n=1 Tax=Aristolochia fimbriata TaxID=158543 RepID=A0AAV7EUR9_ARIFI|nr:hypothetical protein H6P81_004729 [Aristolochia fimbriata]